MGRRRPGRRCRRHGRHRPIRAADSHLCGLLLPAHPPQQKKAKEHQNYLANLKKGDKVITGGGIHGQIASLTDTVVTLEIAENVRIKVNRGAIAGSAADLDKQTPAKAGG